MKKNIYYILVLLVLIGFFARLQIFGINEFPSYAYNYDASNHLAIAEHVYDGNLEYMPSHLADSLKDVAFFHVPFPYIVSAAVSNLLDMSYFNGFYVAMCLFDALIILALFFVSRLLFKNNNIALLSSALYILPLPAKTWFSTYQYGMFTIIFSLGLTALILWNVLSYVKKPKTSKAAALSILLMFLLLTHFLEFLIISVIIFTILLAVNKENKKQFINHIAIILFVNLPAFIYFIPRILFVWNKLKPAHFHLIPEMMSSLGFMLFINKLFYFVFALALIAVFLFFIFNKKWNKEKAAWIFILFCFAFFVFGLIYFVSEAEYYIKMKYMMPVLLIPLISYLLFVFSKKIPKKHRAFVSAVFLVLFFSFSAAGYSDFKEGIDKTNLMTAEQYLFLYSIRNSTPEDSRILFLPGFEGWKCLVSKRVCFEVDYSFLKSKEYSGADKKFHGIYAGHSLNLPKKINHFNWVLRRDLKTVDYLYDDLYIKDFDYIALRKGMKDSVHLEIYEYLENSEIVLETERYLLYRVN